MLVVEAGQGSRPLRIAKPSSISFASSRPRCVSVMFRFSICAENVYIVEARTSATMVMTTASSVSVKPEALRVIMDWRR